MHPLIAPVRRARSSGIGAVALALLVAGCSLEDQGAASRDEPRTTKEPLVVGVSLATQHYDPDAVTAWEDDVGRRADVLQTFVPWRYAEDTELNRFPADRIAQISERGRTVEVTWTPADPTEDDRQEELSLGSIADGDHDEYVREFARDVRGSGESIRLRFAHEMNGQWSLWAEGRDGNERGDYVRAWRHLHELFAEEGADDVTWVWSPNIVGETTDPLDGLYPGDDYVDLVGIDGYSYPDSGCPDPDDLFDETLTEVREVSGAPVALAEVGVDAACDDRDRWVTDLFTWASDEGVVGITYWERDGDDNDYRLLGDGPALEAFGEAAAGG